MLLLGRRTLLGLECRHFRHARLAPVLFLCGGLFPHKCHFLVSPYWLNVSILVAVWHRGGYLSWPPKAFSPKAFSAPWLSSSSTSDSFMVYGSNTNLCYLCLAVAWVSGLTYFIVSVISGCIFIIVWKRPSNSSKFSNLPSNVSVVVLTGRTIKGCADGLLFIPTSTSAKRFIGSRDVFWSGAAWTDSPVVEVSVWVLIEKVFVGCMGRPVINLRTVRRVGSCHHVVISIITRRLNRVFCIVTILITDRFIQFRYIFQNFVRRHISGLLCRWLDVRSSFDLASLLIISPKVSLKFERKSSEITYSIVSLLCKFKSTLNSFI